jgi:hypothetical protein
MFEIKVNNADDTNPNSTGRLSKDVAKSKRKYAHIARYSPFLRNVAHSDQEEPKSHHSSSLDFRPSFVSLTVSAFRIVADFCQLSLIAFFPPGANPKVRGYYIRCDKTLMA